MIAHPLYRGRECFLTADFVVTGTEEMDLLKHPSSVVQAEPFANALPDQAIRVTQCSYVPRPHPELPGVALVPLTRGQINWRPALIDASCAPIVAEHRWTVGVKFGIRAFGHRRLSLTSLVLGIAHGDPVGHRNNDPFDCRVANLLPFPRSNIRRLRFKLPNYCGRCCSSEYKGVTWSREKRLWKAAAHISGVRTFVGYFKREIDAALAHDEAVRAAGNATARVNFPEGNELPARPPRPLPPLVVPKSNIRLAAPAAVAAGCSVHSPI